MPTTASTLPENGILRCYNMLPTQFGSIDAMTADLPRVQALGFNAVWLNPIQEAGARSQIKADKSTGVPSEVAYSIYAMRTPKDFDPRSSTVHFDPRFDPRFSAVQRDSEGNYLFSEEQKKEIRDLSDATKVENKIPTDLAILEKIFDRKITAANEKFTAILVPTRKKFYEFEDTGQDEKARIQDGKINSAKQRRQKEVEEIQKEQREIVHYFDKKAIKKFTKEAKERGITPMFDLVLNHVAKDSPLVDKCPKWFAEDNYFPDTKRFRYEDPKVRDEVIEKVWKPYIDTYITEYGFEGVRLDCVSKIPPGVRKEIISYIKEVSSKAGRKDPVILEEALFSGQSAQNFSDRLGDTGGSHITGGSFYARREWHGGMPENIASEDGYKSRIVSKGAINFTGNHDHHSCGGEILLDMAQERLSKDPVMLEQQRQYVGQAQFTEATKLKFLYPYVEAIEKEIQENPVGETARAFTRQLKDRLAINMLGGSAGYYMLSGDERGSTASPEIFLRAQGEELHPQRELKLFQTTNQDTKKVIDDVLDAMALNRLGKNDKLAGRYGELDADGKQQILAPFRRQIINEINGGEEKACIRFAELIEKKGIAGVTFTPADYAKSTKEQPTHDMSAFIQGANEILAHLPPVQKASWSEMFMLDTDTAVVVRKNGLGYRSPTDIIFYSLSDKPDKPREINEKDIKTIAGWMQNRGFPPKKDADYYQTYQHIPSFHDAWNCVMGAEGMEPATVHTMPGITIADNILGLKRGVIAPAPPPESALFDKVHKAIDFSGITSESMLESYPSGRSRTASDVSVTEGATPPTTPRNIQDRTASQSGAADVTMNTASGGVRTVHIPSDVISALATARPTNIAPASPRASIVSPTNSAPASPRAASPRQEPLPAH